MTVLEIESVRGVADADTPPPERIGAPATREIGHEYTRTFPALLNQLGASLLVSTYQAGKVVAVGVAHGELTLSYHNFERAMGMAVKPGCVAVGARAQVWFLRPAPDLATRVEPVGRHDACFLTRSSHFTGEIQAHELAWAGDELWLVNTAFGCLCTLDGRHSFVPRWRPPFLTALAADDRCHLNGVAVADGAPKYVTALAETDTPQGWRADKVKSGCLIDVASGQTVSRGFAMPHSPRVHRGRVWMLHSGAGQLVLVDPAGGKADTVTELPGYTRGLALYDCFAFVGLSKIRETATFGGMPIAARRPELKCGVGVVESVTITGVPPIVSVLVNATGNATQLGQFTLAIPHTVNRATGTGIGSYQFTAANGDTLSADFTGKATPTPTPGVLSIVENATITGGTGRFAGATGGFTCQRLFDTVAGTTVGSFNGTISVPVAGHP